MPLLKDVLNESIKKDHCLIGHQASFNVDDIGKWKIKTWEIKDLNHISTMTSHSLHDYIMAIPQLEHKNQPLFHLVDHLCLNQCVNHCVHLCWEQL